MMQCVYKPNRSCVRKMEDHSCEMNYIIFTICCILFYLHNIEYKYDCIVHKHKLCFVVVSLLSKLRI